MISTFSIDFLGFTSLFEPGPNLGPSWAPDEAMSLPWWVRPRAASKPVEAFASNKKDAEMGWFPVRNMIY